MSEAKKLQDGRESEKKKRNKLQRVLDLSPRSRKSEVDWIVPNSLVPLCYRTDHGFMVGRVYISAS